MIGVIGQGTVGKSYADDFKDRGYMTICYALEEPYRANKNKIKDADVVFVCVPTPTTPKGFDASIVEQSLSLVGRGKIAVVKSTIVPGTTRRLQKKYPLITLLCSPELLNVETAVHDAAHPFLNIIGMPGTDAKHYNAAKLVHSILANAPFSSTCMSEEAEIYKYAHNVSGYMQVLMHNIMYDLAQHFDADWRHIRAALEADPMISKWYINPVHKGGRGAGGPCFIKDFAALAELYAKTVARPEGSKLLKASEIMNIALLRETSKDLSHIEEVYGPTATD